MNPSRSSFFYLSDIEELEDLVRVGIALDAVERIVISRQATENRDPNQSLKRVPGFIEDTCCHDCGKKIHPQDIIVLDSLFYLWHQHCYQETEHTPKGIGTYNEVASKFWVFIRNHEDTLRIADNTVHNIETDSEKMIIPF